MTLPLNVGVPVVTPTYRALVRVVISKIQIGVEYEKYIIVNGISIKLYGDK
jgi:hypothetical protein